MLSSLEKEPERTECTKVKGVNKMWIKLSEISPHKETKLSTFKILENMDKL